MRFFTSTRAMDIERQSPGCMPPVAHLLIPHFTVCPSSSCWILVVDSQFAITCSGDPYRYVRTGAYATILGNEVAVAKLTHSGKWGEPFIRKGADAGTKKVKAARVIYW